MANDKKQMSAQAALAPSWIQQREEFLLSKGWEKLGESETGLSVWRDPQGSNERAKPTEIVILPAVGGGTETIRQMRGPAASWDYGLHEAVWIQMERDKWAGDNPQPSPLERLERVTENLNQLEQSFERLIVALEAIAKDPRGNLDNIRLRIREEVARAKSA